MAHENIIAQVRTGMPVQTADGQPLGKVTQVWVGTDPTASSPRCDDDTCSRLEVRRGGVFKRTVLYVPISAIAAVAVNQVTLTVDAPTVDEREWVRRPGWITAMLTTAADEKNEAARRVPPMV